MAPNIDVEGDASMPQDNGNRMKPATPFESARHRPEIPDGILRVVIISSGSVASIKIPEIVGALYKVRATRSVSHAPDVRTDAYRCRSSPRTLPDISIRKSRWTKLSRGP